MGIAAMDILCCRITIGDADPSNPMRIQNGVEITEVQSLEINESYKKLIGTAKVIFPKGSVCRSTIIGNVTLEGKDVSRITTEVMQDGVIIEKRSAQRLVDETTFITEKRPDVVFVAMGSPKQELLMEEIQHRHKAIFQGLGGSFDVYTGHVERAPKWWVNHNLEFAYRLLKEPKRIKRQIHLIKYAWWLITKKL